MPRRNNRARRRRSVTAIEGPAPAQSTESMAHELVRRGLASSRIVDSFVTRRRTQPTDPSTPTEGHPNNADDQE